MKPYIYITFGIITIIDPAHPLPLWQSPSLIRFFQHSLSIFLRPPYPSFHNPLPVLISFSLCFAYSSKFFNMIIRVNYI